MPFRSCSSRVARISQRGGGFFWKCDATVNELDPNFPQSWTRLRRFFCQNQVNSKNKGLHWNSKGFSGPNQVIIKKKTKGLHWHLKVFFFRPKSGVLQQKKVFTDFGWAPKQKTSAILVQTTSSPSLLLLPNPVGGGGLFFIFGAKIALPPGCATELR